MGANHLTVCLLIGTAMTQGCRTSKASRRAADVARPLLTGYENRLSAPLGPGGEFVARTQIEWDSGWKALGLPGSPPPVDFTKEVAALRADYMGASPVPYESGVDSARSDSASGVITVYAHMHGDQGGVDTASRKVLAAALRVAPSTRVTVRWRLTN